jgi:hypothetical protein
MKSRKKVFDRIDKIDSLADGAGTVWRGKNGIYIIRPVKLATGADPNKKPVAHVILNSKYFTGLFRTKKHGVFSADILTDSGKTFLIFNVDNAGIEIIEKKKVAKFC